MDQIQSTFNRWIFIIMNFFHSISVENAASAQDENPNWDIGISKVVHWSHWMVLNLVETQWLALVWWKGHFPVFFIRSLSLFFLFFSPLIVDTWSPECCSHAMIALLQPSCSLPLLECNLFHLLLGKPSFEIFLWTSFTKGEMGWVNSFSYISLSLFTRSRKK